MKKLFLKRILSAAMALTMTAGVSFGYAVTTCAEAPDASVSFAQKLTNNSSLSSADIIKGGTVTIKAKASGGSGQGYSYAAAYKKTTSSKWTMLQNYGSSTTVTLKPAAAVDYNIMVKVKDSTGTVTSKQFLLHVHAPLKNTSTISKTSALLGESVTVQAAATGGIGTHTYTVIYKKTTDSKWTTRQYYKTNSSITLTPSEAADYTVCVKAKDEKGNLVKKNFSLHVTSDATEAAIQEVFRLTNEERQKVGLPALKQDTKLMKAAAKRAQEITENFAHTRPDGTSCFTVLDEYNVSYWAAGENIAYGQSTPAYVMNSWMNSSGHKANILNTDMTHIGIGLYVQNGRNYWVQLFAKL